MEVCPAAQQAPQTCISGSQLLLGYIRDINHFKYICTSLQEPSGIERFIGACGRACLAKAGTGADPGIGG